VGKALEYLKISIPTDHLYHFFDYYAQQTRRMRYSELYLRVTGSPGKLFAKALNFTCMKHEEYKVDLLYNLIGKGLEWTVREFDYIN
jgi:hypothetical protein